MAEVDYDCMIKNVSKYAQRVGSRPPVYMAYNPDGTIKQPQDKHKGKPAAGVKRSVGSEGKEIYDL